MGEAQRLNDLPLATENLQALPEPPTSLPSSLDLRAQREGPFISGHVFFPCRVMALQRAGGDHRMPCPLQPGPGACVHTGVGNTPLPLQQIKLQSHEMPLLFNGLISKGQTGAVEERVGVGSVTLRESCMQNACLWLRPSSSVHVDGKMCCHPTPRARGKRGPERWQLCPHNARTWAIVQVPQILV